MKTHILFSAALVLILVACKRESKTQTMQAQAALETPEVLNENSSFDVAKSYPRYNKDIVQKLYQEALEKNEQLQQLDDQIAAIFEKSGDAVSEFHDYTNVSQEYWQTADRYINSISDTALRAKTAALFKSLAADYNASLKDHNEKIASITVRKASLQDQLYLLKLFVTQPMIKTFQENEKPDLDQLQQILKDYDSLINETKTFISEIDWC